MRSYVQAQGKLQDAGGESDRTCSQFLNFMPCAQRTDPMTEQCKVHSVVGDSLLASLEFPWRMNVLITLRYRVKVQAVECAIVMEVHVRAF
jgi:hypothetical protein